MRTSFILAKLRAEALAEVLRPGYKPTRGLPAVGSPDEAERKVLDRGIGKRDRERELVADAAGTLAEFRVRAKTRRGRQADGASPVTIRYADGKVDVENLANDRNAIQDFMKAEAARRGFEFEDLTRQGAGGRPGRAERERLDRLAVIVEEALKRGAKQVAVADVIGVRKQKVSELSKRALRA